LDSFEIYGFYPGRLVTVLDKQGTPWSARMLQLEKGRILIHYDDWDSIYDEWIDSDSQRIQARIGEVPENEKSTFQFPDLEDVEEKPIELYKDANGWYVYCNQCQNMIQSVRVYCTYCESHEEQDSFDLCTNCFECNFPYHKHPRTSFARDVFTSPDSKHKDKLDLQLTERPATVRCAFCQDTSEDYSPFISLQPFIVESKKSVQRYWAHDACARFSPEVYVSPEGDWYNVSRALSRGKNIQCVVCKLPGATIGCFHTSCPRSYHAKCTGKSVSFLAGGMLCFCPRHEAIINRMDDYDYRYQCDSCGLDLSNSEWHTCKVCSLDYFNTFDLCSSCYVGGFEHEHEQADFELVSWDDRQGERKKEIEMYQKKAKDKIALLAKHLRKPKVPNIIQLKCAFCRFPNPESYHEWHNGLVICKPCFDLQTSGLDDDTKEALFELEKQDFVHDHYVTRQSLSQKMLNSHRIQSTSPLPEQLYSLQMHSTFFDIPTRAPRWSAHLGQDYHGSWLPQIPHRFIQKYTLKSQSILSNFLGRGTDAIECLGLERRCIGIDINPSVVKVARMNSSFEIPYPTKIGAAYRPMIMVGDARSFSGELFKDGQFDMVLSHPPYKDCIQYSTMIEQDLSRISSTSEFLSEMTKVVEETHRLLKPDGTVLVVMGDNRKECYFQPLSFQVFDLYLRNGFEMVELIVKRQRHCQGSLMGSYLSNQHDFLMIQHEFMAAFRKVEGSPHCIFSDLKELQQRSENELSLRSVSNPKLSITQAVGSVWVLQDDTLLSRMIHRFGRELNLVAQFSPLFLKKVFSFDAGI
jgi:SAM-dependent methyltransferase